MTPQESQVSTRLHLVLTLNPLLPLRSQPLGMLKQVPQTQVPLLTLQVELITLDMLQVLIKLHLVLTLNLPLALRSQLLGML